MATCVSCGCYIGGPVKGKRRRVPGSHPPEFTDVHSRPAMCARLGGLREQILEENAQGKNSIAKSRETPAMGMGVTIYELAFPDGHKSAVQAYGPARQRAREGGRAVVARRRHRLGIVCGFAALVGAIMSAVPGRRGPEKTNIVYSGEAGGPRRTGAPTRQQVGNPRHRGRRGGGRMKGRRG